jgi:predicted PurR-regulated permease PerM
MKTQRLLIRVCFIAACIVCCYEAWALWGVVGLVVGVPIAALVTIIGFRTFSPR